MKLIRLLCVSLTALVVLFLLACGGENNESVEGIEEETIPQEQPEFEAERTEAPEDSGSKDKFFATRPGAEKKERPRDPDRTEEIEFKDLKPGTCAYYAYWFTEYFTSGDTAKAISLCNDRMAQVVRAYFQQPKRLDFIKHNKSMGYTVLSVSTIMKEKLRDTCVACLTVDFMDMVRDECNLKLLQQGDEWQLVDWETGKPEYQ
jgi:hypothetical protein